MMIHFSRRALRCAALATLLLPAAAFLLTWVRLPVSVPCVLAIAAAFILYSCKRKQVDLFGRAEDDFALPPAAVLAVVLCALAWTFFSGIGGYFYQNEDHYGRNAIFHDLLNHSWPVYFDGTPYALDYYVGFWILPALVGKLLAALMGASWLWPAANAALFVQTAWFLALTLLLLLAVVQVQALCKVCLSLVVFVLFSGMDMLMARYNPEAWRHQIEWWAQCYQFSSNTTCLFWVYNQAVPAWLATMLLLSALSPAADGADGVFHRHGGLPPDNPYSGTGPGARLSGAAGRMLHRAQPAGHRRAFSGLRAVFFGQRCFRQRAASV